MEAINKFYTEEYLAWKNWTSDNFGKYDASDELYFDKLLAKTKLDLNLNLNVLEIGFGSGKFLGYGKSKNWLVRGAEINQDLVIMANSKGYDAIASTNIKDLSADTFDLIVLLDVLEHISKEDLLGFIENLINLLKTNGTLVARFPNGDSPFSLPYQNGDLSHLNHIGSLQCEHIIEQLDLKKMYIGGDIEIISKNYFSLKTIRKVISIFIKRIINLFVQIIFYGKYDFCSRNLVMVLSK